MESEENEQPRICSIVFVDIAQFSQQPGEVQFSWRIELSMLLDRCQEGIEPDRRIVTDTNSGAVIAFLSSPEDALSFVRRLYDELPKLQNFALRVGVHLGPLRVVQGVNGRPGVAGESVNAAQRAMRFADVNEVLVSRTFWEEILRLSPGSASMFSPHGKQSGKLGREYELFRMGSRPEPSVPSEPLAPSALSEFSAPVEALAPKMHDVADAGATPPVKQSSGLGFKIVLGALLVVVAVIVWLWVTPGDREHSQAAPPAVGSAVQEAVAPTSTPRADDSPVAVQPKQASSVAPEKPHLTDVPASGKVAAAKKDPRGGQSRCPNCSCTDLMTKLSLGDALNEAERRYLTERCKK